LLHGSIARHGSSTIPRYLQANANAIRPKDQIHLDRIRNIKKFLKRGEKVIAIALQPRMLPGGSYLIPNVIYATNERIIVFDPHASDLNGGRVSIPYTIITGMKLEERPYSTFAVKFEILASKKVIGLGMIHGLVGGENRYERSIDAMPKAKAEELIHAILYEIGKNSIRVKSPSLWQHKS
jgi:hypothetical protein